MRLSVQTKNGRLNTTWVLMGGLALLGTAGCLDSAPAESGEEQIEKAVFSNQVILDWSLHTENAMVVDSGNIDPLPATRTLSIVHVAMHDAINSVDSIYDRYAYTPRDSSAHPVAAAAAAAHRVLVRTFPGQTADLDAKLATSLAAVPNGTSETRGVTLGVAVGNFIFDMRANDGAAQAATAYTPGTGPGKYQFVPPFDGFVNKPGWRFVRPWVMSSPSQFRSAPPPSLTSTTYKNGYNEVKLSGILSGSDRSTDETKFGKFWYENSDTGWNRIARTVAQSKGLLLYSTARLFALMNMAMADGFVAGWDSKFHYDFWRPFTAIRAGSTGVTANPTWEPLLATPPVQDYPSTHSVLGRAAAEVLRSVLGDNTSFTATSSSAEQPFVETRSFTSFTQAALQNADSRVQAGLHFRFSCNAGLLMGEQIGDRAYDNFLRPD